MPEITWELVALAGVVTVGLAAVARWGRPRTVKAIVGALKLFAPRRGR